MVRRTRSCVRIRTRRGYDWTDRFPRIVEAAGRLRVTSFLLDGEGVILRPDGDEECAEPDDAAGVGG